MREHIDILVEKGFLITMDGRRRIIEKGAVAIEGNKILDAGKTEVLEKVYTAKKVIDATNKIVMPGLICTHSHVNSRVQLAMPVKVPPEFYERLKYFRWPMVEDQLTKDDVYAVSKMASLEMTKMGVTCVADLMEAPNAIPGVLEREARAFMDVGIRGVLAYETTDRISSENGRLGIDENSNFIKKWNRIPDSSITGMVGVHTVFSCLPSTLKKVREVADELNAGIHLHVEESKYEVEHCKKEHGKLPVEYLDDLGFLANDVLAAQCVNISDEEIEVLSKRGVRVSHNPQSNMGCGVGIAPIPKMLERGLIVGLGHDGGYLLDMFDVIRTSFLIHKGHLRNPLILPAIKVIEMATIDGARTLNLDREVGSVEKGKKADIIILSLSCPTPMTAQTVYNQIVALGCGATVDTTIIDGKIVMEERKIITVNEQEAKAECLEAATNLWRRNGLI